MIRIHVLVVCRQASAAIRNANLPTTASSSCFRSRNRLSIARFFSSHWNWSNESAAVVSNQGVNNNNSNNPLIAASIDPILQTQVLDKCGRLHSSIMPLNEKIRGPLAKNSNQGTALPFVFLVGNHSSGKSSFINYILGRPVQVAGVAPTDDTFTVILPGPQDNDQDGPALIGDPDLGFSNLRQFGPTLIHHTQLKIRKDIQNSNFMLVDSPGMIDSPHQSNTQDRGYDFQGVVKWFAERADIVLLFFDPDKPGTTGETLSILLHSLGGMDHKLLIILNKADQFKKIHDFARAYGSLCWNLSKVIPRKDLPRIFTMCLPVKDVDGVETTTPAAPPPSGLADLHQTRNDVVKEVMKAPKRRIDNVITHLYDSVHQLKLHATLCNHIRQEYRKTLWQHRMQEGTGLLTGSAVTSLGLYLQLPMHWTGTAIAATVLGVGGLSWFHTATLQRIEDKLTSYEELSATFQRVYAREVNDGDEYLASVWQRIRDPLKMSLETQGLSSLPQVTNAQLAELDRIINVEIPELRRIASPTHHGKRKSDEVE